MIVRRFCGTVCVWRQRRYVTVSLGRRPRNLSAQEASAESANQFGARSQFRRREVNRAFSADVCLSTNPGALPQAGDECCAFGAKHKRETPRRLTQTLCNFVIRISGFFRH